MNLRKNLRTSEGVHTSALNDILFILLFFFLIVATLANPNIIKLSNPTASSDSRVKQHVVVSINPNQEFFVGTQATSYDGLTETIKSALTDANIQDGEQPIVVINADSTATAANIVAVMRAAKTLNAKSVMSVTNP